MNILIVGLGMIGSSYAQGLSKEYNVYGVDIDEETIKKSIKRGYIKDGSTNPKDFIDKSDLIILCMYPKDILDFLNNNTFSGQIITDVTGVKGHFIDKIELKNAEFIGSHPMAGSEKSGVDACNSNVFKNANFLITKNKNNSLKAINMVKEVANCLGFGRIKVMDPSYHDDVIAYTSQLPHAIAVALVNSDDDQDTPNNAGDSFRDLTRIASINDSLWSELFIANKDNLIKHITRFEDEMNKIKSAVLKEDYEELRKIFRESKQKKDGYNGTRN